MKFIHLSDLHLGKRVNEFSMIEDQKDILIKIINIIDEEKPDGILIAGDVYDRSVPSEEAMQLWDDFLNRLAKRRVDVYVISGNHDSAIRLADHSRLIENAGIHVAPVYDGAVKPYTLEDENGRLNIYLLPFIKPVNVRAFFGEETIEDYTDACRVAIEHMEVNPEERNILVAHQFVAGASRCDSEEASVGGLDSVSCDVFDVFDYVALGHIHGRQRIGRDEVRYCGTPLKYSISEKDHKKTVTVVEFGAKGEVNISERELVPRHDLREIRGSYEELTLKKNYENTAVDDYLHVVLTDEEDVPNAMGKLGIIYPNIMRITYDNRRTGHNQSVTGAEDVERKTPLELFKEFYELQNNTPMSKEQENLSTELINGIWEE